MKKLIILRGTPGAGKSTWVKQNKLENYTLCPDTLRLMFAAPVLVDGQLRITREMDIEKKVWQVLLAMLESRMERGDLTVIDATCRKFKDIRNYAHYCHVYGYELIIVDFSSVPLNVCLLQNSTRDPLRFVPEEAIIKIHNGLQMQDLTKVEFEFPPVNYEIHDWADTEWLKNIV